VEPAAIQMKLSRRAVGALEGVLALANAGSNPAVTAMLESDVVTFRCDTYWPMLAARLDDAFAGELGADWHGEAKRVA
jgi:hypothetical protein